MFSKRAVGLHPGDARRWTSPASSSSGGNHEVIAALTSALSKAAAVWLIERQLTM